MAIHLFCALAIFIAAIPMGGADAMLRSTSEIYTILSANRGSGMRFDLIVTATANSGTNNETIAGEDSTGAMVFRREHPESRRIAVRSGDTIRVGGAIRLGTRTRRPYADCETLEVTGHGPSVPPQSISGAQFHSGRFDCRPVTLSGTVRDLVSDEIDPLYTFAIVRTGDDETVILPLKRASGDVTGLAPGVVISATGICTPFDMGGRRRLGRLLHCADNADIRIVSSTQADPFDVPDIRQIKLAVPEAIAHLGRHCVSGWILAVWQKCRFLLKTDDGDVVRVELADGLPPDVGQTVDAVGFPESDLYRINLTHARWSPTWKRPATPARQLLKI